MSEQTGSRRIARGAALLFLVGALLGLALVIIRLRQNQGVTAWQDDYRLVATTSSVIHIRHFTCPLALDTDEPGTVAARIANEWTREVPVTVTFHTEDWSSGAPSAYVDTPPLREVSLSLLPGEVVEISYTITAKTAHGSWMPIAVKARNGMSGFGSNDYDSRACPIWITHVAGLSGRLTITLFCLMSLFGMTGGGAVWITQSGVPPGMKETIPIMGAAVLGFIALVGEVIFLLDAALACVVVAALIAGGIGWQVWQRRHRESIQSVYRPHAARDE
jgi:hypothetical protein